MCADFEKSVSSEIRFHFTLTFHLNGNNADDWKKTENCHSEKRCIFSEWGDLYTCKVILNYFKYQCRNLVIP